MIISTTQFKLKSLRLYGEFFVDTYRVVRQVRAAGGIVHMRIRPVQLRTITVWKTVEDMQNFRQSGAHMAALKKTTHFGSIRTATWEAEKIPSWREAIKRLDAEGS